MQGAGSGARELVNSNGLDYADASSLHMNEISL
jgi:hypothetical protein